MTHGYTIFEPTGGDMLNEHPVIAEFASWADSKNWKHQSPVLTLDAAEKFIGKYSRLSSVDIVSTIGFVAPCLEFIQVIERELSNYSLKGVVEVGAGKGLLSAVLQRAGIDSIATDIRPESFTRSCSITHMSAEEAIETYPDRAVLMSWPEPSYLPIEDPSPVGRQVLRDLKPGGLLFYIHDKHYTNERILLQAMRMMCMQVGQDQPLPVVAVDENVLRVFRKSPVPV